MCINQYKRLMQCTVRRFPPSFRIGHIHQKKLHGEGTLRYRSTKCDKASARLFNAVKQGTNHILWGNAAVPAMGLPFFYEKLQKNTIYLSDFTEQMQSKYTKGGDANAHRFESSIGGGYQVSAPLTREERLIAMFDSYCKSVLQNTSKHLHRQRQKQGEYEGVVDSEVLEAMPHEDKYPSDSFVIYVDEMVCIVRSTTLYAAFLSMPIEQQKVLILDFWESWKDKEIADYIGVSVRTVYNLRQRAYRTIKSFYEK